MKRGLTQPLDEYLDATESGQAELVESVGRIAQHARELRLPLEVAQQTRSAQALPLPARREPFASDRPPCAAAEQQEFPGTRVALVRAFGASPSLDLTEGRSRGDTSTERRMIAVGAADSLAEALFSLAEPWRSRFLTFLANRATRWAWNGRLPTRQEAAAWLGDDNLYEAIALMLYTWQGSQPYTGDSLSVQ